MKKIPIGVADFKKIILEDYYFVDKSILIKDILEDGSEIILLPRPRRFGKTINMSMLKYFFSNNEKKSRDFFNKLKINEFKDIMEHQGKYPVIYVTFKDMKHSSWEDFTMAMKILTKEIYRQFESVIENSDIHKGLKVEFDNLLYGRCGVVELSNSLKLLSEILNSIYNEKVVILVDEYDVPIQAGYSNNYYDEIISFMRNFLSGGFKDNNFLYKGVLTGILRVAKESIFSGLNNIKTCTLINEQYSDYFGFQEDEVNEILNYYNKSIDIKYIRAWYNGYKFGDNTIYNPWSILNYIDTEELYPYWVNTSSNNLVRELLAKSGEKVKIELEMLIEGKTLRKRIDENIVMSEINNNSENLWSFLLLSGYLKYTHKELQRGERICDLAIPNEEVRYVYRNIIMSWFKDDMNGEKYMDMLKELVRGEIDVFEEILQDYILSVSSYFDIGKEPENFYHALVLGMMVALTDSYTIKSNKESGYGRYDIMMIPKDITKKGLIIEFKKVRKRRGETLEKAVEKALTQIEDKKYESELRILKIKNILKLGIAFDGKEVMVREA